MRLTVGQAIVAFLVGQCSERRVWPVRGPVPWWDVPIAEISELESVTTAHRAYQAARASQRRYL